jgi:hypothetical protein
MLKVFQILKFLAGMDPQKTPARLSFFNFLKNYADPNDVFNDQWINLYFSYSMDYPHWESNKLSLGNEIRLLLESFNRQFAHPIDLTKIKFPQEIQVIEIESQNDFIETLQKYLKNEVIEGEKLRILPDQSKKAVAIVLKGDGSLAVTTFDRKFTLRNGQFEPLRKDLTLHYNSRLELQEGLLQKVEVAPYITAQFKLNKGFCSGALIRGYVYQKYVELKDTQISTEPKLFYPLKRIEQFFVDRRTDPYYNELVRSLEIGIKASAVSDRESLARAQHLLQRAENSYEHIFAGDKLLNLLIRDLRHTLSAPSISSTSPSSQVLKGRLNKLNFNEISEKPEGDECLMISPIVE